MTPRAPACLHALVQAFFDEYLPHQRALSPRTVESYRDALRLLLGCIATRTATPLANIRLGDFTPERIQAFLDHLEYERHNSIHSRNLRLAALRAFLRFAAPSDNSPERTIEGALRVPMKRFTRSRPRFLTRTQMLAIIGRPDGSWIGQRDHALLSLLYDSAATVSELVRLRRQNIALDDEACVHLRATRRVRSVPLRPETVTALRDWLALNPTLQPDAVLFPNQRGAAMTATCVRRRLALAVARAAQLEPELRWRAVSPRIVRHTAAMHLLQCGTEPGVISRRLGHDTPATMHNHARAFGNTDRTVLAFPAREPAPRGPPVPHSLPEFLEAL